MNDVVIASRMADAEAATAVEQHHAQLAGSLVLRVEGLVAAATGRDEDAARDRRDDLVAWCTDELMPHALAEEQAMYPHAHARPEGRLLIEGMIAEHAVIGALVSEVADEAEPVRAAAAARALLTLFESHLSKENELVLPMLLSAPDVSLAAILEGMHELLGEARTEDAPGEHTGVASGCGGHACGCGEVDPTRLPELDARLVPHSIRHATVFGALDAVQPGAGLVLVASHDPLPLLSQVEQRTPGTFTVDYLERGPETWRLRFFRSA